MISTRDIVNIPYNIVDKLAVISLNVGDEIIKQEELHKELFLKLANQVMNNDLTAVKEFYEQLQEWRIILDKKQEEFYEELILKLEKQCMNNDPTKLLTAKEIYELGQEWIISLNKKLEETNEEQSLKLAKQLANYNSTIAKEFYESCQGWRIIFNKRQEELNKQIIKFEKQDINDPTKLLAAKKFYKHMQEYLRDFNKKQEELNEKHIKIKNEFLEADKIIPTLSTISQKHQDPVYIRQLISTELINAILNAK
ncbi:23966_t:CDS:2 [Gigaspora margarita]|uniref:23966_t:CDS:1 n=1 Tax=Gigaspora margarita TaxID=4874 RepID=A0ABN7V1A9_GIGMA|nr:23966_t:CDS:2 [Gigaspora margarita]